VATLLLPTAPGLAFVSGHDTAKRSACRSRRSLGYHAGSDQGFYPRLTGRQNLLFLRPAQSFDPGRSTAAHRGTRREISYCRRAGSASAYAFFPFRHRPQRLSLARALLHKPTVLLLERAHAQAWMPSPPRLNSGAFLSTEVFARRKNFFALSLLHRRSSENRAGLHIVLR